jgi:hypothetical protein
VVCLTEKAAHEDSLGSLVSLRGEVRRRRLDAGTGYAYRVRALKDKRRGPGWVVQEQRRGVA